MDSRGARCDWLAFFRRACGGPGALVVTLALGAMLLVGFLGLWPAGVHGQAPDLALLRALDRLTRTSAENPRDAAESARALRRARVPLPPEGRPDFAAVDFSHAAWRVTLTLDSVAAGAMLGQAGVAGGFGAGPGHAPAALDTAEVLLAASEVDFAHPDAVRRALAALVRRQRADGGFAANGLEADLPTTCLSVRALSAWRGEPSADRAAEAAVAWLRAADLSPQPVLYSALRADALAAAGELTALDVTALLLLQGADGGFFDTQGTAAGARALAGAAADLQFAEVRLSAADAPAGPPVTLHLQVRNGGLTAASASRTSVEIEGEGPALRLPVPPLAPGEVADLSTEIATVGRLGGVGIIVRVDADDAVAESDEADNERRLRLHVRTPAAADLEIRPDLLALLPSTPTAGQAFTVQATVRNRGDEAAGPTRLALYRGVPEAGGALLALVDVPGVAAHAEAVVAVALPGMAAQATRLVALVDPDGHLGEVHTGNNRAVRALRIAGDADLALLPGALMLDPGPVVGVGTTVRFAVRVQNRGRGAAGANFVSLEDAEGPEVARVAVPALAAGAVAEVSLSFTPDAPGPRALLLRADADDTLVEVDEVDNFAAQALIVEDADLAVDPRIDADAVSKVSATDSLDFSFFAHNQASLPAPAVRTALRQGSPDGPVHVWGHCGPFAAAPGGGRTTKTCPLGAWIEGLPVGPQTLYACVDADHGLVERDETNNCQVFRLDVEARRDVRVTLAFDPPAPDPGQWVGVTWRTQADATLGHTVLRIRAGDEPVFTRAVGLNASETLRWRAPDARGDVPFVATLDAGRDVVDADRANNRFEATIAVGGPPSVVEVSALAADRRSPAVAGRAGFLRIGVDAPTQVDVDGMRWPAAPGAPAHVPYTPPQAGEDLVAVATAERPAPLDWPVESRRAGRPTGLAAAFAPEGVALTWNAVPGAASYVVTRDGRPIGASEVELAFELGPPGVLAPRGSYAVALPDYTWVGALGLDLSAAHDSLRAHWRVDALTESGRWTTLHAEGGAGGAPASVRTIGPVRARHLRLHVLGATLGVFPARLLVRGFAPVAAPALLDDRSGAEPGEWAVAAQWDDALGEASAPTTFDRALEAPGLEATADGARVHLTVAPLPGRRATGYLVEVDGEPLPSGPLSPDAVYPVAMTSAAVPLALPVSWPDGTAIRREVVSHFDVPRFVSALPAADADIRWAVSDAVGAAFAPGLHTRLRAWRPAADDDTNLVFDPTMSGPPMLPAAGGAMDVTLRSGLRTLAVYPVDADGRRGIPATLPVAVGGPRGLSRLSASAEGDAVRLLWEAPPEIAELVLTTPWGQVERVPAGPGTHRFTPRYAGAPVAGHVAVHVVPVDTLGNSAPPGDVAVDLLADLPPVEALTAQVRGFRVELSWTLPRRGDAVQFALTLDDAPAGGTLAAPTEIWVPAPGRHTVGVAPMTAFGAVGPPTVATFDIADDGGPRPIELSPPATWVQTLDGFAVDWSDAPDDDAVALDLVVNAEATAVRNPQAGVYVVAWKFGIRDYRVSARVRDGAGRLSDPSEATLTPPAFYPADGFRAGPVRADGSVPLTAPAAALRGHFVYRDGVRLCAWENQGMGAVELSGGQWAPHLSPFGRASDDNVSWVTDPAEATPRATVSYGFRPEGTPVDRLPFEFATPGGIPDAFHVDARAEGGAWVEIARVRDHAAPSLTLDLPDTPRVGARALRLTVDHHTPGRSVVLSRFTAEVCRPPAADVPARGGRYVYTARTWGPDGSPGPASAAQPVDVPLTNLQLAEGSLRLSDDEFLPGDTVAVVAPVANLGLNGAAGVEVVLRIARTDCAVDAVEVSRARVDVAAGATSAAVLAWPVDDATGVLCVEVDPEDAVPEQREDDNTTSRTVVPDRAYRTQTWANGELALFACDREIDWAVRPSAPDQPPTFGTLLPGQATALSVQGGVTVSADGPFGLHVGALRNATSTHLRDCQGSVRTQDVTGDVPQNRPISPAMSARSPGVVVFAPEAAAHVLGSEPFRWDGRTTTASGLQLFEGDVAPGAMRFFNPHVRPGGLPTESVRLTADAPIIAWSYADLGFPFVGADGRMAGTDLRGFVALGSSQFQRQANPGEEIVVVSYDADNRIELERTDTGQRVASFLLPAHGMGVHFFPAAENDGFIPLRVRATGRTAAFNMSLFGSPAYGYDHSLFVPGESGLLFDRRFVVPLTTNGRDQDFAPVTALYDATTVRVLAPDTGDVVYRGTLARGAVVDLLSDTVVTDHPARRRLVVESDRPVSVYMGVGVAGAEMAPVLFAPENRPDLRVMNLTADPPMPLPGELLAVHGEVHNEGVARARSVLLRIYDGPPGEGRELHSQRVPRLDAGQPVSVDFVLGLGEGVRVLTWVVDPDDTVVETREDNNVAQFTLANPPDLVAAPAAGALTVGQPGVLALTVHNEGGQSVEGARLRVYADQALLGETRADVPPNGTAQVEFPWRPAQAGPAVVRLEVEAPAGVEEARVDNNRATSTLEIAPVERDLVGQWTSSPESPGPHDPVSLAVRLGEPTVVRIEAFAGDVRLAAGRTEPDGRGTLTWAGEKALGAHPLRLVVDSDDAIAERDEANNTTELVVEVVPYALSLNVEGPARAVAVGSAVDLRVTPTAAPPEDTLYEAPGFAPAPAAGEATVVLHGLAPEPPGPTDGTVGARRVAQVVGTGATTLEVAPDEAGLALRIWPAVAGPGVAVTLEAAVAGEGTLVFEVDGEEVTRLATVAPRGILRAVVEDAVLGPHAVQVELRDVAGAVRASAAGAYERAATLPTARVDIALTDQRAAAGSLLTVPVTLTNPNPTLPVSVSDVVVAVTDEPPTRVLREDRRLAAHLVGAAAVEVEVTVGPLPWRAGPWRLVVRAEGAGGVLGVGTTALELFDTDAEMPTDAGAPDAGPDPRADLGRADAGGDPRVDLGPADAGAADGAAPVDGAATADAAPNADLALLDADAEAGPSDARAAADTAPPALDARITDARVTDARVTDARTPDAAPATPGDAGGSTTGEPDGEASAEPDALNGGGRHPSGCDCRHARPAARPWPAGAFAVCLTLVALRRSWKRRGNRRPAP